MVGLGATQDYAIAIALVAVLGFALTLVGIGSQSLIQTQVREAMRGRVLSLWAAVAFSAPAIGSVVIGSIADRVGLGPTTFFSGLLCLVLAILLTWRVYHTSSATRLASDHRSR
jgi:MFS family permease